MVKYWTMRDGTRILIKDMDNRHLLNTIRMLQEAELIWSDRVEELLLLRAECRAAREMRRVFDRLSLHVNDGEPIRKYDEARDNSSKAGVKL